MLKKRPRTDGTGTAKAPEASPAKSSPKAAEKAKASEKIARAPAFEKVAAKAPPAETVAARTAAKKEQAPTQEAPLTPAPQTAAPARSAQSATKASLATVSTPAAAAGKVSAPAAAAVPSLPSRTAAITPPAAAAPTRPSGAPSPATPPAAPVPRPAKPSVGTTEPCPKPTEAKGDREATEGGETSARNAADRVIAMLEQRIQKAIEFAEQRLEKLTQTLTREATPRPAPSAKAPAESAPVPGELEEVAASFRRAMSEAIDRKLEELITPIVTLHQRFQEEARLLADDPKSLQIEEVQDLLTDSVDDLTKALKAIGGGFIVPKVGEFYDPLIHLAVGEAPAPGDQDGVVASVVRPGYRSARGKVVVPARVLVGRR